MERHRSRGFSVQNGPCILMSRGCGFNTEFGNSPIYTLDCSSRFRQYYFGL